MILKVFTKKDDPQLDEALIFTKKYEDDGQTVEYYNLDDAGAHQLAEIFEIFSSPSFVVTQDDGREINVWRGEIPPRSDLSNFLRL
jgi:DNA-binding PadR family transcriptional regulator